MKGIKLLQIFSVFTEELSVSPDIAEQIVYVFGMQSRFASGWLTGGIPGKIPEKADGFRVCSARAQTVGIGKFLRGTVMNAVIGHKAKKIGYVFLRQMQGKGNDENILAA